MSLTLHYPNRPLWWDDIIDEIQACCANEPDVFLVGGAVRDAYRNHPFKDIDLCCAGDGLRLARRIANQLQGAFYPLDRGRAFGRCIVERGDDQWVIDVTRWDGDTLKDDLASRDFAINAMAVPLAGDLQGIYDPFGGLEDWNQRVLRRVTTHAIGDDPVRGLRAVRQSLQFDLRIEPETLRDIRHYAPELMDSTSEERIRDEFFKILGGKKPSTALRVLKMLGMLSPIVPEVDHLTAEEWQSITAVVDRLDLLLTVVSPRRDDNVAANVSMGTFVYLLDPHRKLFQEMTSHQYPEGRDHRMLLVFTALMRYSSTPQQAAQRASQLKISRQEVTTITHALHHADLPAQLFAPLKPLSMLQIYHFWDTTRASGFDALWLTLAEYLADRIEGTFDSVEWAIILGCVRQLMEQYPVIRDLPTLINGHDLMDSFGLSPSETIGELLAAVNRAQFLGEVQSRQEALSFAQDWLDDNP